MLPDWAPNLHPLIVHFPISLLVAAALVDVAALGKRSSPGIHVAAVLLYVAGALGALAAYATGNQAAETVYVPTEAIRTLNQHQDLALYTLLFFAVFAIIRVAVVALKRPLSFMVHTLIVMVGIGGQVLVWRTGDRGGELVFAHGVGVSPVQSLDEELRLLRARERAAQAAPEETPGGGFSWLITYGAEEALAGAFTFVEGAREYLNASVTEIGDTPALVLEPDGRAVMIVRGGQLIGAAAEMEVDLSEFNGSVSLVHNVRGPGSYHYLRVGQEAVLGRVVDGSDRPMGGAAVETPGWTTLRATADRGHFYGYVDGQTIAHGHASHPAPGQAGMRIEGTGTLRLRRLEATPIP